MDDIVILGISGSTRKGATLKAVKTCLAAAETVPGVRTELIDLSGKKIMTCTGCNACRRRDLSYCPLYEGKDDFSEKFIEMYRKCDGVIVGSPIYMMNPTGLLNSFFSRMRPRSGTSARVPHDAARFGGCIAVGGRRNGGQESTIQSISGILQTAGFNIVGGDVLFYNGAAVWSNNARDYEDSIGDLELEIMGRKVAYLTKIMRAGLKSMSEILDEVNTHGFTNKEEEKAAYEMLGLTMVSH